MEERIRLENGAMPQTGMPNSQAADPAAGAQPLYTAKAAQPFKVTWLQLGAALYSYLLGWFYFCGLVLGGPVLPFAEWYVGSMNPVALGVFCALFSAGRNSSCARRAVRHRRRAGGGWAFPSCCWQTC